MFEKPKKTKVKWHGQDITLPFDCSVYEDKVVKIKNRFTGEETEMPGYAASVYDTIIGAEQFEAYEIVRAGLYLRSRNISVCTGVRSRTCTACETLE